MQLAAPEDAELVGIVGLLDAQRDVGQRLAQQPLADLPAGDVLAVTTAERRVVDLERHADRRLVDYQRRQRLGRARIADRVGDLGKLDAGEGDDVARARFVRLDAMQAEKAHHLHDALVAHLAFAIDDDDRAVAPDLAALDAPDADRPDVARIVEQTHLQLQRAVLVDVRRRAVLHDGFEQRRHVGGRLVRLVAGEAAQRRGVHDREVELRFARAELVEQVERLVEHPVRARFVAVDLVDDHDRPQAVLERLLRHEARLRHRPVDGVDQQQHGVDHRQHALDLAAEVGVAGRVDDVDAVVAPLDRGVLRQDRDAALALQRVRIHDALGHDLARSERAGLLQELIDERGLAMIDVRDDGDVAKLGGGHGNGSAAGRAADSTLSAIAP